MRVTLSLVSAEDVHIRSFGLVDSSDSRCVGGLYDPRIFGPPRSWECACGRVRGRAHSGQVCIECLTSVGSTRYMHRTRWGHIALPRRVRHPCAENSFVEVIPVLPIAFRRPGSAGADFDMLYRRLLGAAAEPEAGRLEEALNALLIGSAPLNGPADPGPSLRSIGWVLTTAPHMPLGRVGALLWAMCLTVRSVNQESMESAWSG